MRDLDLNPSFKKVWVGVWLGQIFFVGGGTENAKGVDVTNKTQYNGVILDSSPVGLPGFTGGCDWGSDW